MTNSSNPFAAVVIIFNEDDEVLTVSRRNAPKDIGLVGGKLNQGETSLQAAVRETLEETGVKVLPENLEFVFQRDAEGRPCDCYFARVYEARPRAMENGFKVRWAKKEELLKSTNTYHLYNRKLFQHISENPLSQRYSVQYERRIDFFKLAGTLGFCSNFSRHEVEYRGKTYMTSEHVFQAMKFLDPLLQELVRSQPTPTKAAAIGRDRSLPLRSDWETADPNPEPRVIELVKDRVMYDVVLAKFRQHPDIAKLLLESGSAYLLENTAATGDAYWGEVSPGVGLNRLGRILMSVRDELRSDAMKELVRVSEETGLYDT